MRSHCRESQTGESTRQESPVQVRLCRWLRGIGSGPMKTAPSDDQLRPTEIAILCAVAVISNFSYAGLPAFVGAYGEVLHLDLATSGWLATAEGVGYALALLWYACRRATDPPPRLHIACFLLPLAVAQIASAAATTPPPAPRGGRSSSSRTGVTPRPPIPARSPRSRAG